MRGFCLLLLALSAAWAAEPVTDRVDWAAFLARNDLRWSELPKAWTQGPFIGNGLLGAMIYHDAKRPGVLRFDLSRSDLYHRAGQGGLRVPTGHLELALHGRITAIDYRLDLHQAEARGTIRTEGGVLRWRSYVHADEPFLRLETEAEGDEVTATCTYVAERAMNTRKIYKNGPPKPADYEPEPVVTTMADLTLSWQPFTAGGGAATAIRQEVQGQRRTVIAGIAVGWTDEAPKAEAQALISTPQAKTGGLDRHRAWWDAFYRASFLSIPDARLESFYWTQLYKLGSATRADRPAIDLMGPWFQPSAWLAYWTNLNIQLTYWPVYAANHPELGESLSRWVGAHQQDVINNAPEAWRSDSAYLPRVTARDLRGDGPKPGDELGNLPFLLHNLFWQYRYTMDERLLREVLHPLLVRSVNFYRHHLVTGADGRLHLPLATSPEYETKAEDTNYDLALCRWACQTLLVSAPRLHLDEALIPVWKDLLERLTPYPVDSATGFMIGAKVPLDHSHRHFSHLFMVYPLATFDLRGPERSIVETSVNRWLTLDKFHAGYSLTGGASMAAYLGDGEQAVARLTRFTERFVKPNTFYIEGSNWPVIETPLSGARALQDLVVQSWGDALRVFPAVPAAWADVTVRNHRTEGAFLVSALRRGGATRWLRVESLAGEPCRLYGAPADYEVLASKPCVPQLQADGSLVLPLAKGAWVELRQRGAANLAVAPVERPGSQRTWGLGAGGP